MTVRRARDGPATGRPVIFGEVLFDRFPDGTRTLGGAPFNVAWHLQGFGADPLMLTAIGRDDEGREVLDRMAEWGLDRRGVQVDPDHATGRVEVDVVDGEPRFHIPAGQSWDHIDSRMALAVALESPVGLVYHGTLAARKERSRHALAAIIGALPVAIFADVNLRDPWWSREGTFEASARVSRLKLNQEELALLARADVRSGSECLEVGRGFARQHSISHLIVTRGAEGAIWVIEGEEALEAEAAEVTDLVDTVGAGDAFSAILCLGMLEEWPADTTLARASRFAAEICGIQGATVADASLYDGQLHEWSSASPDVAVRKA